MPERSRHKPEWQLKIAAERIEILFHEAAKAKNPALQKRYVQLAKKIGMRYNVRIPGRLKRTYCKYCYYYFGSDVKRRLKDGFLTVKCPGCGKPSRFPYK